MCTDNMHVQRIDGSGKYLCTQNSRAWRTAEIISTRHLPSDVMTVSRQFYRLTFKRLFQFIQMLQCYTFLFGDDHNICFLQVNSNPLLKINVICLQSKLHHLHILLFIHLQTSTSKFVIKVTVNSKFLILLKLMVCPAMEVPLMTCQFLILLKLMLCPPTEVPLMTCTFLIFSLRTSGQQHCMDLKCGP